MKLKPMISIEIVIVSVLIGRNERVKSFGIRVIVHKACRIEKAYLSYFNPRTSKLITVTN